MNIKFDANLQRFLIIHTHTKSAKAHQETRKGTKLFWNNNFLNSCKAQKTKKRYYVQDRKRKTITKQNKNTQKRKEK